MSNSDHKGHILLIDDDETFTRILGRSLQRRNWEINAFNNAADALNFLNTHSVDHILLDLKLDKDSGLRWIKPLKEKAPNSKLLLLTGYASIATAVEAVKLGASDYLTKPVDVTAIEKALNTNSDSTNIEINEKPMSVSRLEWEHIQKVLHENDGNVSATARSLNMHRRTLQRKLAKRPVKQ